MGREQLPEWSGALWSKVDDIVQNEIASSCVVLKAFPVVKVSPGSELVVVHRYQNTAPPGGPLKATAQTAVTGLGAITSQGITFQLEDHQLSSESAILGLARRAARDLAVLIDRAIFDQLAQATTVVVAGPNLAADVTTALASRPAMKPPYLLFVAPAVKAKAAVPVAPQDAIPLDSVGKIVEGEVFASTELYPYARAAAAAAAAAAAGQPQAQAVAQAVATSRAGGATPTNALLLTLRDGHFELLSAGEATTEYLGRDLSGGGYAFRVSQRIGLNGEDVATNVCYW